MDSRLITFFYFIFLFFSSVKTQRITITRIKIKMKKWKNEDGGDDDYSEAVVGAIATDASLWRR